MSVLFPAKAVWTLVLAVLFPVVIAVSRAADGGFERLLNWTDLPALAPAAATGLRGAIAGGAGEALLLTGGTLGDQVFVLPNAGGSVPWRLAGKLPEPLTGGVALPAAGGLLHIGGEAAGRPSERVYHLRWDAAANTATATPVARLPVMSPAWTAAAGSDRVYTILEREPGGALWLWSLALPGMTEWQPSGDVPVQLGRRPVVGVQDNGRGTALFLFGGSGDANATYEFLPATHGWRPIAAPPANFSGGRVLRSGIHHLVLTGEQAGEALWVYHTVTDSWAPAAPGLAANERVLGEWHDGWVVAREEGGGSALRHGTVRSPRIGFRTLDYVIVFLYFGILLGMGYYFSGQEKTTHDFFLAGGRIPWWAAGLSIYGTQLSAITFMSIPAKTYSTDWSYFLTNVGIVAVAPFVVLFFLPFFVRLKVTTAYEYLELRFNLPVRLLGSAAFIVFQFGRAGIVLYLPALALSVVTGIDITVCIVTVGIVCTIYTVMGGIEAVIWTDVMQVIVLLVGAMACLLLMAFNVEGGFGGMFANAMTAEKTRVFNWSPSLTSATSLAIVLGWSAQLIPYTSDQSVIQRYLTTSDEKSARRGVWTNAVITLPSTVLFFAIGTALWAFFREHPAELAPGLAQHDAIFPWYIVHQLPAGVSGLLVAGIFAASMSSVDSSLNSVATVVVTDFYRRLRSGLDDRHCLTVAKILTVVFGAVATLFALLLAVSDVRSLWDRFSELIGLLGGGLAGLFILGIFTRRANAPGALIGLAASALVQYLVKAHTGLIFFLYASTGLLSCVVVGYLASLLFPVHRKALPGLTLHS